MKKVSFVIGYEFGQPIYHTIWAPVERVSKHRKGKR